MSVYPSLRVDDLRGGHQPSMMDIQTSIDFCKALRKEVGNKADLLFGTHGQFTTTGAIRLGKALEEFKPLWFEEPIPPEEWVLQTTMV